MRGPPTSLTCPGSNGSIMRPSAAIRRIQRSDLMDTEDAHVFCTTILGNLEVISRCDSAIFTAQRRAIRRYKSAPRATQAGTTEGAPASGQLQYAPSIVPRQGSDAPEC